MATTDEQLVSSLLAVMRSLEKPLSDHVVSANLTVMQFVVLEMLLHKGELTINDIIAGSFSSSGNISVVIENLIKAGYLEKKRNPNDGRSRLIALSPLGRSKISAYYPEHKKEISRLLHHVDNDEKQSLIMRLQALRNSVEGGHHT